MPDNIFLDIPVSLPDELNQQIASNSDIRIERIVSKGHKSEDGFWYDQDQDEWVLLLKGAARIQFEDEVDECSLSSGDHLLIPAHKRHRVSWTSPEEETIWLAVFSSAPLQTRI